MRPGAFAGFSRNGQSTRFYAACGVASELFVKNERVICIFSTPTGPMAVILVGAMLVGSINTPWEGIIAPASKRHIYHWHYLDNKISLLKGQEVGQFQLGSTVIILFAPNRMKWLNPLSGKKVKFGENIGQTI